MRSCFLNLFLVTRSYQSINQSKITKNLSQNEVHSDPDLILYNPSVLIDKEPKKARFAVNKITVNLALFF
ncbi:hypothetical protein EfmAA96_10710 [Enterococcus faecium]|nr:hypothetical protein EfmAA96_10710 [Enterococcus faecium]